MSDDEPSVMGAAHLPIPMPTEADRHAAYKSLYVARMVARGVPQEGAEMCFEAGEVDYDVPPDEAADDEMSYWDADDDGPV